MNIQIFFNKIKTINLQNWYVPLVVTTLFFVCFFTFFTPIYETNDDVFFTLIANGYYTKDPTPFFQIGSGIQTIHIVIGKLLVFLYTTFPDFNWYSFLMYTLAFLGLYALLIPIFQTIKNRLLLGILLVLLLLFITRLLLFLSFTSVAATGTMGGVFLLLFLIRTDKHNVCYFFLAGVLLMFSQLVRQTSFIMIIIFSLPLTTKILIDKKRSAVMLLTFILLVLSSIWAIQYTNITIYSKQSEWNEKMNFLLPLGTFFYEPSTYDYSINKSIYKSLDWSKNDYAMIASFFYDDKNIFSSKKLQTLLISVKKTGIKFPLLLKLPAYLIFMMILTIEYILIHILILVVSLLHLSSKDKKYIIFINILVLLGELYFLYKGYLPPRVILSMIFFLSYTTIFLISDKLSVKYRKIGHKGFFLYIFILAFILVLSLRLSEFNNTNKEKIKKFKQIIKSIPTGNSLTLIWGSSIPYEWQYVFSTNSDFKNIHFLIGSWTQRSPLNETIKAAFSVDNLAESLYSNKHIFLVATSRQKEMLKIYFQEHFNVAITYDVLDDYSRYGYPSQLLKVQRKTIDNTKKILLY